MPSECFQNRALGVSVIEWPFASLRRFRSEACADRPSALVVAPLSGLRPTLLFDCLEGLGTVFDVHLLAWRDAASVPARLGPFGLAENVGYVVDALRTLGPGTHLFGLCQSALVALSAAAIVADDVDLASIVLIGGKLDTRIRPTRLDRMVRGFSVEWVREHALEHVRCGLLGAGRLIYPALLQQLVFSIYLSRHFWSHGEVERKLLLDDGIDPIRFPFAELVRPPLSLPGEFLLDTVSEIFHNYALPENRMTWQNQIVSPSAIRAPALCTVEGGEDDIAAPGQTEVAQALCSSIKAKRRFHHLQPGVGHFGLFHGRYWRGEILPRIVRFLGTLD